jgi:SAM-dependent methyltransferase
MRPEDIALYRDPDSGSALVIAAVEEQIDGLIKTGTIATEDGSRRYPIREFVPRFVPHDNYARSFGLQWNRFRTVQLDSHTGLTLSKDRFFDTSGWTGEELRGRRVLEAGCGAGRFTEVVLRAGADLYSVDYSDSVDAVRSTVGPRSGLHLAQADLYSLPFPEAFFDRIFCYGVLQHTPDPRRAFHSLVPHLKRGGLVSIDIYRVRPFPSRWNSKYLWRPLTRRLRPETLFRIVEWYVPRWLPLDTALSRVPPLGAGVASLIPCWNYTGILPLSKDQITNWAILDTFDALSPRYDKPATLGAVRRWFEQAGLTEIEVRPGGNGIVGNGRRS